jgi:hypothetical protein
MDPLVCYKHNRDLIRQADCVVWSADWSINPTYWPGKIIQLVKGCKENHASIIIRYDDLDINLFSEALLMGPDLTYVSERLMEYKGKAWLLRLRDEFDPIRDNIAKIALRIGSSSGAYDWIGCGTNIISRPKVKAPWYCSELDYYAIRKAALQSNDKVLVRLMQECTEILEGKAPRPDDLPKLPIFKPKKVRLK